MTHIQPMKLNLPGNTFTPRVIHVGWTADLYRSVTISVAPGRRLSAIVGPRGATDSQVTEAVKALMTHLTI